MRTASKVVALPTPASTLAIRQAAIRAEARVWRHLARIGLPLIGNGVSFASCRSTPALEAARAFVDEDGAFRAGAMVMQGGVGCGKSTSLHCAARAFVIEALRDGDPVDDLVFHEFPRLSRMLLDRDTCSKTLQSASEAWQLIVDDLGAGYTKADGFVVGACEEILIHREANHLPLLMSTNLEPSRFRAMFGERVFDRLRGEWGSWINVSGPSLRRKPSPR